MGGGVKNLYLLGDLDECLKGIVQRILRRVETRLIRSMLVNWRPVHFFKFKFKGTQSQKEHETIFSHLKSYKMALSDQIDFLAIIGLRKMSSQNFVSYRIRQSAVPVPC